MRILSRYIVKEITVFFTISILAFTGLLLTLRMLRFASLIINRGVEVSQIARIFMAIIPTFLEIALPMSTLLAVMLAFARLSGDSEIIVIRASGISLFRFLIPVGVFAVLVGGCTLYVSTVLRPWGFRELGQTLFEIARSRSTSGLYEGVFNKLGAITIYAEQIDFADGDLQRVMVDDRRDEQNRKIVFAQKGRITSDETNRTITILLFDGVAHEEIEGKYVLTNFSTNNITIDPETALKSDDNKKGPVPRELSTLSIGHYVDTYRLAIKDISTEEEYQQFKDKMPDQIKSLEFRDLKKLIRRLKIEYGQRLSLPFASFIMAFIGMALGIQPPRTQRTWGAGISALLGLAVFTFYYGALSLGIALAESGNVRIWLALWIPNIVALLIAGWLISMIGSEKWQSVADLTKRLPRILPRRNRR